MEREIRRDYLYKHYKGAVYLVLEIAKDVETKEDMVVYCNAHEVEERWIRPLAEFSEKVGDVPRFAELGHAYYMDVPEE